MFDGCKLAVVLEPEKTPRVRQINTARELTRDGFIRDHGVDAVTRFWRKVDRSGGDDACWPPSYLYQPAAISHQRRPAAQRSADR